MLKRLVVVTAVLLACASAEAQYGGPHQIQPTSSAVWGELAFFTGEGTPAFFPSLAGTDVQQTVVSMLFEGYVGIDPIELDFAWGFAHGS